jgi:hypothetical protein
MPQAEEELCLNEFRAFASGGNYAIDLLNNVWMNIAREYGVDIEKVPALFKRAGLVLTVSGRIFPADIDDNRVPVFPTRSGKSELSEESVATTPGSARSAQSIAVFSWD